jgi:amino acid permease
MVHYVPQFVLLISSFLLFAGAGIVGLPYAIKEAGLVAGTVMIILCAVLTGV